MVESLLLLVLFAASTSAIRITPKQSPVTTIWTSPRLSSMQASALHSTSASLPATRYTAIARPWMAEPCTTHTPLCSVKRRLGWTIWKPRSGMSVSDRSATSTVARRVLLVGAYTTTTDDRRAVGRVEQKTGNSLLRLCCSVSGTALLPPNTRCRWWASTA